MKKRTFKVYKDRFKAILAFSIVGAYGISGATYGFNDLNKTLIRDYESIRYNKTKLVNQIENDDLSSKDYNKLDKICFLRLDMSKEKDLYYLKYFTNLKYVEVFNAEYLNDLTIEELNNSCATEINLYFDRAHVLKNLRTKFDLSRFKNKYKIKNVKFMDNTNNREIDSIILFEYLINYEEFNLDISRYEELNTKLDDIIEELDLDLETYNNIENLFKITNYVINKINYDEKIKKYNANHKKMYSITPIYRKTVKYNEKSLSIPLKDEGEVTAICTNYADLETALAIKGNVCVNTVKGDYLDEGHAWNVAMFKDYDFYFDPTRLDSTENFTNLLNKYLETHLEEDFNNLVKYFVIDFESERGVNYKPDKDLDNYISEEPKECNEHFIYGTNISELAILLNGLYGFLSYEGLCLIVVVIEVIKRKLKNKKEGNVKTLTK